MIFLHLNLHLFDGGAGAGGAAGAGAAAGGDAGAAAGTDGAPSNSREGTNGETQVIYGKQPETDSAPAAEEQHTPDPKEREATFRKLISEDYKDLYTQETQRIIDKRFKETKGLQESLDAQAPVMAILAEKYGTEDPAQLAQRINGDAALWQDAAEEAGLTVEQYRQYKTMERQNAMLMAEQRRRMGQERARQQMSRWQGEAAEMATKYPGFDLQAEAQNPQFLNLLQSHVPMEWAYKTIHMEELMQQSAQDTERRITDNIRSRGQRPAEGATSSQPGAIIKSDVSKLSAEDRRAIAEKVRRGESISF